VLTGAVFSNSFACYAHSPVFGGLLSARSADMAFDLSMPILVVDDYSTM